MHMKTLVASLAVAASIVSFAADPMDSQSTVEQGKWCNDFQAALDYADANNVPLLVFRAKPGCGQCSKMEAACKQADFLAWQAERKFVMAFVYGSSKPAEFKSWMDVANKDKLTALPLMGVYWKANASGQTVLTVFTGRSGKMYSTNKSDTLQKQLMDSVDTLTDGWNPGGVTPTPTPTPTPTVDVRSEAYGAKQTLNALVTAKDSESYLGTAAISIGAIKNESVKVTVKVTLFSGKTYTAKQTLSVGKDGSASGGLTFKDPLGGMACALAYDSTAKKCSFAALGDYAIETIDGTIGGAIAAPALVFSATSDTVLLPPAGYAFVTDTNVNEPVYIQNGTKFTFAKAPTLKYVKSDGSYVLKGLDDSAKTNVSGLKLTYKSTTGQFSGSFKLYASNAASVKAGAKPKLGKYTATVKGAVINGVGYGAYTVKIGNLTYAGTCVLQ